PGERFYEVVEESKLPHLGSPPKPPVYLLYNITGMEIHLLTPSDEDEL
ncbi:hypothetical protein DBR06_SOUSAS7610043, partial [Sousa chinensis]